MSLINVRVTAQSNMFHGCLETARNHVISVQIQKVSSININILPIKHLKDELELKQVQFTLYNLRCTIYVVQFWGFFEILTIGSLGF